MISIKLVDRLMGHFVAVFFDTIIISQALHYGTTHWAVAVHSHVISSYVDGSLRSLQHLTVAKIQ